MSWNNIPNDRRLYLWKNLRDELIDKELFEQLHRVSDFFRNMPYGTRTLDYYTPEDWPTPWEILYNGTFCRSSISILMFHTLRMLPNFSYNAELLLIDDGEDLYLLPRIDNNYILNYELGTISNSSDVCKELKIIKIFTTEQIKEIN